jgi:hypothetical protein
MLLKGTTRGEHVNYFVQPNGLDIIAIRQSCHLANRTNLVHNSFLVCLFLFSTHFGHLCAHYQEKTTVSMLHLVFVTLRG